MKQAEVPEYVYRVGRRPDPWAWPDWAHAGRDGTFGNRYDDPGAVYRVLYASSERVGTFLETLARFRPDPEVVAELRKIVGQRDDVHNWALFEPHVSVDQRVELIAPDDPDLDAALALLDLRLEGRS